MAANIRLCIIRLHPPKAFDFFIVFFSAPFPTSEASGSWTVLLGSLQAVDETFYPGGSGIARELANSKPELLNEGLGGGWARGVGRGLRPGDGSREDHSLQHW